MASPSRDRGNSEAEAMFRNALASFVKAGRNLAAVWEDEDFNADERWPLPKELAPPMSFDEWIEELAAHYDDRKEQSDG